jgi:dTMP kinase
MGALIAFEGVEGAGKTTQVALLARRLDRAGVPHRVLREPGGTLVGDRIRAFLLDPASDLAARTEALLFMASRAQLVEREIVPALSDGCVVLLDRFFLSTYAYQVAGRRLPEAEIWAANALATGGVRPDVTLVLTLPVHEGLHRASHRGARDRMEQQDPTFHARVEGAFADVLDPDWQAARSTLNLGPIASVDATGTPEAVHARIVEALRVRVPFLDGRLVSA